MGYDLGPDALGGDLVCRFFWQFSVFECALKREGFLHEGFHGEAQADWAAFADSIVGRFGSVRWLAFEGALELLESQPPRHQVVNNGRLAWEGTLPGNGESRERFVLRLVRVVRNNLFHGGKYPDGPIPQVERDSNLISAALEVLRVCYELHPHIARWRDAA